MLKNLTIRARLQFAFGVVCVLMVIAATVGGLGTRSIVAVADQTMNGELKLAQLATELRVDVLQLRRFEKDVFINIETAGKVQEYRGKWEQSLRDAQQARSEALALASDETRAPLNQLEKELEAYAAGFRNTLAEIQSGSLKTTAEANAAMSKYKQSVHQVDALVLEIVGGANKEAGKVDALMKGHSDSVMTTLVGLTVASLLFAASLSIAITRGIVRPVRSAVQLARSVADGKLGHDFTINSRDEVAELLHELSRMDSKLCEIIGEVHAGAGKVRSTAAELAENNDQLSQRTQGQASSLEETAAAIEEMTAAIKANASSATNASNLARSASEVATAGGKVVTSAVGAMSAINDSSRRIADIISVIDEIAFQTNLLALNAAVEAARAGEMGRGFAVVAGEVRSLAQRSADAAKEIKQLIGDSVEKVRAGSQLVSMSGEQLQQIVESVRRVAGVVEEIASANSQQASGVSQLNDSVSQLDHITQQNAAGTEEIAAASKMMHEQSERLAATVSYFSIPHQPTSIGRQRPQTRTSQAANINEEYESEARYGT
ncbi:methyl-accepting chemotaxis protein [Steroidobacter flavus]|uniref:Methyl-accepting chemotaxis protein n=1 Tax=Steroidobacter flavus TaxID=1842136 RepID=A0ABV8SN51_9GAMM